MAFRRTSRSEQASHVGILLTTQTVVVNLVDSFAGQDLIASFLLAPSHQAIVYAQPNSKYIVLDRAATFSIRNLFKSASGTGRFKIMGGLLDQGRAIHQKTLVCLSTPHLQVYYRLVDLV